MDKSIILGVPIGKVSMDGTMQLIEQWMNEAKFHQIATVNPEFIMRSLDEPKFLRLLQTIDLCLADGIGVVHASRWLKNPVPERVPGSELIIPLAKRASEKGWSLFLLGAAPGVADETAVLLTEKFPTLKIAGCYAGSPREEEAADICQQINHSNADILLVAYGAPKQDFWLANYHSQLPSLRLGIGVGGSFDFLTGKSVRAPRWIRRLGLEWLHRLYQEPWRWRRMLALPHFVWAVWRSAR